MKTKLAIAALLCFAHPHFAGATLTLPKCVTYIAEAPGELSLEEVTVGPNAPKTGVHFTVLRNEQWLTAFFDTQFDLASADLGILEPELYVGLLKGLPAWKVARALSLLEIVRGGERMRLDEGGREFTRRIIYGGGALAVGGDMLLGDGKKCPFQDSFVEHGVLYVKNLETGDSFEITDIDIHLFVEHGIHPKGENHIPHLQSILNLTDSPN